MTDTPQTVWMREYERRRAAVVYAAGDHGKTRLSIYATEGDRDTSRAALTSARTELDAHVRGLVEENERLRRELREIAGWCESHGHPESRAPNATTETQRNWAFTVIAEMGKRARNALAATGRFWVLCTHVPTNLRKARN